VIAIATAAVQLIAIPSPALGGGKLQSEGQEFWLM